jgi:hypothetical protein
MKSSVPPLRCAVREGSFMVGARWMVGGMLGHIKMPSHTTRPIKRRRLGVWTVYVPGVDIDDVDPIVSGGNLRSDHAYQRPDRAKIALFCLPEQSER